MAATQDLELFVRDALSRGQSRDAIEAALDQAGWPKEQIRSALGAYSAVEFPVPVPILNVPCVIRNKPFTVGEPFWPITVALGLSILKPPVAGIV